MTYAITGQSTQSGTVSLQPTARGCSSSLAGVFCTLVIPGLQPCPTSANCYDVSISTYDQVSCNGDDCTIPKAANALSSNQDVGFSIADGQADTVNVTLDGLPTDVAIVPVSGGSLSGSTANGFTISKCLASEQVDVLGLDADGNYILGAGAPTPHLASSNANVVAVTAPASTTPNRFTLTGPFANGTPASSAIPSAGTTLRLTATVTPLAGSGGSAVDEAATITVNHDVCGVVTEFAIPTAASDSYNIAAGPDGALWFTEEAGNKIGRITTSGTITETPLTSGFDNPEAITGGSDGALYFIEFDSSPFGRYVGRITTGGSITADYSTPNINNDGAILSGPDGGLWIGNLGPNIADISTSGTITPIPLAGSQEIWGLTSGVDGNVWFTDLGNNDIGRINASGSLVATYPLLDGDSAPLRITNGPGNTLWFTSATTKSGTSAIYKATMGGALTRYTAPYNFNFITAGPDGNLYLSPDGSSSVVRVTTSGVVSKAATTPSGDVPNSITLGPDGNLWFIEPHKNFVGRVQ